jgi:hypothetical protein
MTLRSFGWGDVLFLGLMGFLLGLATKLGPRMRFFEIAAAQHPELFRLSRLPVLPGSVLIALAFPLIELLTRDIAFSSHHAIYVGCMVGAAVSSGAWLASASGLLSVDDQRKQREITEFLSDQDSSAPSGPILNTSPLWLQIWNLLNFAAFISLMIFAMQKFFHW